MEQNIKVIKRDGATVEFDKDKIKSALSRAAIDCYNEITPRQLQQLNNILDSVVAEIVNRYTTDVKISEIQNIVEQALITNNETVIAEHYTEYRLQRDIRRANKQDVNTAVKRLINRDKTIIHENANKDSNVYATQRDLIAGVVSRTVGVTMFPRNVLNAHDRGDIHIHDLDYAPFMTLPNCSLPNIYDMLHNGFCMGNAFIETPKGIRTAATVVTQIVAQVASSQYGGVTISFADTILAPYAYKDYVHHDKDNRLRIPQSLDDTHLRDIAQSYNVTIDDNERDVYGSLIQALTERDTRKDIYDAMQTMEYQINTIQVATGQTPFTTLHFGLGTSWCAREIQKAILKIRIGGLGGNHRTAIFPKLVFTIKDGINYKPEDTNYDIKQLAIECATKRMYPDIINWNMIISITGSGKPPMGCRSFLSDYKYSPSHDGYEEVLRKFKEKIMQLQVHNSCADTTDLINYQGVWETILQEMKIHPATAVECMNPHDRKIYTKYCPAEDGSYIDEQQMLHRVLGRNNLGVITINLPRIAIESHGSLKRFYRILNDRIQLCHQGLITRIARCKEGSPKNAPILYKQGGLGRLDNNQPVDLLFKNGRATVSLGYIGLYECGVRFYGHDWETNEHSKEAKEFTLNIVRIMHDACEKWTQESGYHYSVYSTPSESLTDTFNRADKEKFKKGIDLPKEMWDDIIGKGYYTNSFHYDVRKAPTPFEKIDFEAPYPYYASGGFIHYVEYPSLINNPKALEAVWDYSFDKIGYFGTNTPIDRCFECGFEGDFESLPQGFKCPQCGNINPDTCDVCKRLCGYLGNPMSRPEIEGRHKEIISRVKHMKLTNGSICQNERLDK